MITLAKFWNGSPIETLETLMLTRVTLGEKDIKTLSKLPKLWQLKLTWCHLHESDLAAIKDFPALIELDLTGTHVDDSAIVHLESAKRLERLRLIRPR